MLFDAVCKKQQEKTALLGGFFHGALNATAHWHAPGGSLGHKAKPYLPKLLTLHCSTNLITNIF